MKKAKIICTLGPASSSYAMINKLIKGGMSVSRLNFSHGSKRSFAQIITNIKKARQRMSLPVAIMQDLQGPKIRVGNIREPVLLKKRNDVYISERKIPDVLSIPVDYKGLHEYVKKGDRILINDGLISLRVKEADKKAGAVRCTVSSGGIVQARKGVNLPDTKLPLESLTEKDKKDLKFGLSADVDIISLSFVRSAEDIKKLKSLIKKSRNKHPLIIAKIEKPEAVKNIDSIIKEADGIMIARGDLAVEIGYKRIPFIQKRFIEKANRAGKIVIVATQMLESMIENPNPYRSEITDIYNAVLDGADTLMLSGETSVGKYPLKVVNVMKDLIKKAEKDKFKKDRIPRLMESDHIYENILSYAAAISPEKLNKCMIGVAARDINDISFLSDYRPAADIAAFSPDKKIFNKTAIYNGVYPVYVGKIKEKEVISACIKHFKKAKHLIFVDFVKKDKEKGMFRIFKIRE
ncbi:MAG: pyruvate kinase [Candidatus Goldiibacteriota bacterium]